MSIYKERKRQLYVTDEGFVVRDMVPGLTLEALQDVTEARLRMAN